MANTVVQNPANPDARFFQLGAGLAQAGLAWGLQKRAQEEAERAQKASEFLKLITTQAASTGTSLGEFLTANPLAHKELLTTSGFSPEAVAEQLKFAQDHPYTAAEQMNAFAQRMLSGTGAQPAPSGTRLGPQGGTSAQGDEKRASGPPNAETGAGRVDKIQRIPPPAAPARPVYEPDLLGGTDVGGRSAPAAPITTGAAGGMRGSSGPEAGLSAIGGVETRPTAPAPAPRTLPEEPVPYIVKAGDTPAGIAAKLGVSTEDVLAAAGISDPTKLQIGAEIRVGRGATPAAETASQTLDSLKTKLSAETQGKLAGQAQKFEDRAAEAASTGKPREFLQAMKGFERVAGRILSTSEARELEKTEAGRAFLDAQVRAKLADPAWRAAYATTSPEARATMEALGREADPLWNALRAGQLDLLAKGAALDLEKAGFERTQAAALVKAAKEIAKGGKALDPEEAKIYIKMLETTEGMLNNIRTTMKGDPSKYTKNPDYQAVIKVWADTVEKLTGVRPAEAPVDTRGWFARTFGDDYSTWASKKLGGGAGQVAPAPAPSSVESESEKRLRQKLQF